jgi:hypothetical protein
MQIIESTSFGVRAAVMTLGRDGDATVFRLFPMVHIADADFYRQVADRLAACDVILAEGVRHRTASVMTLSYRFLARSRRLGLTSQQSFDWSPLRPRMISADLGRQTFAGKWRALPLLSRTVRVVISPVVGLIGRATLTRERLARMMAVEMLPDRREYERPEYFAELDELILDVRDKALIAATDRAATGEAALIGVMFGAAHMRPLLRHLLRSGYHIVNSEFVNVMSL